MNRSAAHDSLVYACIQYLALNGIHGYAINQVSHQGKHGTWRTPGAPIGFPDIVACVPIQWSANAANAVPTHGQFLAIEAKTGTSKPRPDQIRVLAELEAAGATVAVITSVDQLEPIVRRLKS